MIKSGRITNSHRAYQGVQGASLPNGSGVSVYAVVSGGPADKAGLKTGDVITAIGEGPTRPAEYGFGIVRPPARAVSPGPDHAARRFRGFALCDPWRTAGLEALQPVGAMRWRWPLLAWFPESGSRDVAAASRS
ncbi:MAG TPA: PDZ domain-containing protein [Candidatus Nitrosotalea sp.]|nr:PDZ domain-containing protein [Candidatus Nitrosotalea sp.]